MSSVLQEFFTLLIFIKLFLDGEISFENYLSAVSAKSRIEYKLHTSVSNKKSLRLAVSHPLYIIAIVFVIVGWFTIAPGELTSTLEQRNGQQYLVLMTKMQFV